MTPPPSLMMGANFWTKLTIEYADAELAARTVGERVDQNVHLAVVFLQLLGDLADGETVEAGVPLVVHHVLGHVLRLVVDRVEGVDLGDLHLGAIAQDHVVVELASLQALLEDAQHRRPGANGDGGARLGQGLADGPAIACGVCDASDKGNLAPQIDGELHLRRHRADRRHLRRCPGRRSAHQHGASRGEQEAQHCRRLRLREIYYDEVLSGGTGRCLLNRHSFGVSSKGSGSRLHKVDFLSPLLHRLLRHQLPPRNGP
eukprot:scaffold73378_cov63-Phaeocystis_antarctica.AAC.6